MRIIDPRWTPLEEVVELFRSNPPQPGERLAHWCKRTSTGIGGDNPGSALVLLQQAAQQAGVHFGWRQ